MARRWVENDIVSPALSATDCGKSVAPLLLVNPSLKAAKMNPFGGTAAAAGSNPVGFKKTYFCDICVSSNLIYVLPARSSSSDAKQTQHTLPSRSICIWDICRDSDIQSGFSSLKWKKNRHFTKKFLNRICGWWNSWAVAKCQSTRNDRRESQEDQPICNGMLNDREVFQIHWKLHIKQYLKKTN